MTATPPPELPEPPALTGPALVGPPPALITSAIRTITPIVVGWLLALPIAGWVLTAAGVDSVTAARLVSTAVAAVLSAGYYLAVRLLERRWPTAGRLLGRAVQPVYVALHPLPAIAYQEPSGVPLEPPAT